jgi:hypothetical protein
MEKLILLYILFEAIMASTLRKLYPRDRAYWVNALVALGTAAYGLYQANKQEKKADSLKASNYVPPGIKEAELNARIDSSAQPAGYARGLEKLRQGTASAISAAKQIGGTPGRIQQAAADADSREKELIKDLEVNNEMFRRERRRDLNRVLEIRGAFEKESYNALNAAKSALYGASAQNKYNAITTGAEGLVYSLPDSAIDSNLSDVTGLGSDTVTATKAPATTGYLYGQNFGKPRGLTRFQNMKLSPYEEAVLRSRGQYNY